MPIKATQPAQHTLADPQMLEPFIDQFARSIATQETALHAGQTPDVQRALMRVRKTWLERNVAYVLFGAGLLGAFAFFKAVPLQPEGRDLLRGYR